MKKLLACLLLLALLSGPPATAQWAVFDEHNALLNSGQLVEAAATTINTAQTLVKQALELLPLADIAVSAQFIEETMTIARIIDEGTALAHDLQTADRQVRDLFGLDTRPSTPAELDKRLHEIQMMIYEARVYALKITSLISTLSSALVHMQRLVGLIGSLTGNMAANEVIIAQLAAQNRTLATGTAAALAAQRENMLVYLGRDVAVEGLNQIEIQRWSDMPTVLGGGSR